MPEGKVIEFQEGEYPELDGLEVGSSVKFEGQATIEDMGEGKGLVISSMEFETVGMADRERRSMKGEGLKVPVAMEEGSGEDF